jgi:hypothetical protein
VDLIDPQSDYWQRGSSHEDAEAHKEASALVSRAMAAIHGDSPLDADGRPVEASAPQEKETPANAPVSNHHDRARELMMSPAYRNSDDPRHKAVRAESTRLFAEAPGGSTSTAPRDDPELPPHVPMLPPAA